MPLSACTSTFWKTVLVLLAACAGLAECGSMQAAHAFTHIVQPGDTLASLSERFYGRVQNERLVVAANSLDSEGGIRIVPGMRLEIPSLMTVRVGQNETWKDLARQFLGSEARAFAIAQANDSQPWLIPEHGAEVIVPYNLRVVARGDESIVGLAYRYLGDRKAAWMLDQYNEREGRRLVRGEVVLIPLIDLELTEFGKRAAAQSVSMTEMESRGSARDNQVHAQQQLPALDRFLRRGQYVEAVRLGVELSTIETLTRSQLATVHRALLEAYVALDTLGRASESCRHWLDNDPDAKLDPVQISPKILRACKPTERTPAGQPNAGPPKTTAPTPPPQAP